MTQVEQNAKPRTFNPNDHVMQLKSKQGSQDYLPVQWRLVWFRQDHPDGTIHTEIVHLDLDALTEEETYVWNNEKRHSEKVVKTAKGVAIFKATITDGKGGMATGTKMEKAASFSDFLEKAETGAIGRALAALGYGTQFAPELNEQHRIVDAPVDRSSGSIDANSNTASSGNGNGSTPATDGITEQQLSSIRKLSEYLGKPEPNGLATMSNLAAKQVIQNLTAEYRQSKKAS